MSVLLVEITLDLVQIPVTTFFPIQMIAVPESASPHATHTKNLNLAFKNRKTRFNVDLRFKYFYNTFFEIVSFYHFRTLYDE